MLLVQLCDWQGNVLDSASVDLIFDPLLFDGSGLRLARYIDPYGRTTFNQGQMEDFLLDLDVLPHLQPTEEGINRLREIVDKLGLPGVTLSSNDDNSRAAGIFSTDPDGIEQVRRLANRCRDEVDRFLVFEGD